ncbi:hypothetical protein EV368DRAFT_44032 [Lentinula lateritia]|uniref:Uncharacterized protein n=1 Tax=Lentinula aff. lateritia TaxID=2804960 RepID=A0ACC1TYF0_9AGAR|nr:hypothetical protein F5876DRAFT_43680 [Lentinula aff. lateritia]KAJ3851023.1 hypothetical protein EV368DRAFT_44032 [Lentinula lateritia]
MSVPTPSTVEDTPTGTSSGVHLAHDADLLIRTYISSSLSLAQPPTGLPIPLPLCIPQVSVNPNDQSAFARGYNDTLKDVGIPQDVLLNFIDGLNMAIIASPPLRVVGMVGTIIGMVPYHWAMIAGTVISTAAGVATHVLSKTLTDRYLRAANLTLFKPRGLSVRLCTTTAMLALLTSSESKTRSKLNKFGRGVGSVLLKLPIPVINPIASTIIHAIADKPPTIAPSGREGDPINSPVLRRRVAMTNGLALPLKMDDLPPPAKPEGVMDTMASWGVKYDTARERLSEKNIERRRRALESFKSMASSAFNTVNDFRLQMEVRNERIEQQRNASLFNSGRGTGGRGGILGPKMTRMEQKVADADLLEHWGAEKFLWIVVMASDKDEEIVDISIAEDPANEEHIDDKTWRERMAFERDEMELEDFQEFEQRQQQENGAGTQASGSRT